VASRSSEVNFTKNYTLLFNVLLPGVSAVFVEYIELSWRDEFAAVDARLNGSESTQNAHLLHVTDDRRDIKSFQFRVDRV